MKKKLWLASVLAFALVAWLAIGPDAPAQDPPADPAAAAESTEPLETFEPTEKLTAESAVSFPVDI